MTHKKEMAVAALIRAPTIDAAAQAAGVGYSTLRRWLKEDQEFREAYQAALEALLSDAAAQAKRSLSPALEALREIVEDRNAPAAARVQAARSVVDAALKLTEAVDIRERVAALEAAFDEVESWRG